MPEIDTMGKRIIKERTFLGLSRENLAELIDLTPYYLGQIERDQRTMSFKTLVKLSDCLHVTIDYLVRGRKEDTAAGSSTNELQELISKCSKEEIKLLTDVLKVVLPRLRDDALK